MQVSTIIKVFRVVIAIITVLVIILASISLVAGSRAPVFDITILFLALLILAATDYNTPISQKDL